MAIENSNIITLSVSTTLGAIRTRYAHTKNVGFSFSYAPMEVTLSPSNTYRQIIPNTRDVTINFDGLTDFGITSELNISSLTDQAFSGSRVYFRIGSETGVSYYGEGHVADIQITGGTNDAPTYSGTIESRFEIEAIRIITELQTLCTDDDRIICTDTGQEICVNFEL